MVQIRKVAFCPHCGNRAPQKLIHTQACSSTAWFTATGEETEISTVYFTASCETCDGILLYRSIEDEWEEEYFNQAELVYPQSGMLHNSIPEAVAKIYSEAIRIKTLAPNAFAVQIRRALEALCEDRGAKKGILQKRLSDLAAKGEILATLAEVTDVLRFIGNVGAHAAEEEVKPWQVYTIDEFFRTVVEYVYVAPSKLQKFRESLSKAKAASKTESAT